MGDSDRNGKVRAVERALTLLEIMGRNRSLGVRELARQAGMGKSTVQRLLATLEGAGYLTRSAVRPGEYRLSVKLLELGNAVVNQLDLRAAARPHLEALVESTRETAFLEMLVEGEVLFVDKLAYPREVQMVATVGGRAPVHCTAGGKAILAYLPAAEVKQIARWRGLPRLTPRTLCALEDLLADLAATRERGFAIDMQERYMTTSGVAAPIFGPDGNVLAAIAIVGVASVMPQERLSAIGGQVQAAARRVSQAMGWDEAGADGPASR